MWFCPIHSTAQPHSFIRSKHHYLHQHPPGASLQLHLVANTATIWRVHGCLSVSCRRWVDMQRSLHRGNGVWCQFILMPMHTVWYSTSVIWHHHRTHVMWPLLSLGYIWWLQHHPHPAQWCVCSTSFMSNISVLEMVWENMFYIHVWQINLWVMWTDLVSSYGLFLFTLCMFVSIYITEHTNLSIAYYHICQVIT